MNLKIYSDGGARGNPGPAAIGVVVCADDGTVLYEHSDLIGEATNNIAEYLALIAAIEIAKQYKPLQVSFFLDSELVVKQLQGEYRVKDETLRELYSIIVAERHAFRQITFTHVPRTHAFMKKADALVNYALDRRKVEEKK
jgi:ribonuclease HI